MNLKKIFLQHKEVFQFVYGIFLIVLIPVLMVFNSVFIIKNYNKSIDSSIQRSLLVSGRLLNEYFKNNINQPSDLNLKIQALKQKNNDFLNIRILEPRDGSFFVIASFNPEDKGKKVESKLYNMAWMEKIGDGFVTNHLIFTEDGEFMATRTQERSWVAAMPIENNIGEKSALLEITMSSRIVDDITQKNRNSSMVLTVLEIIVIIIFLSLAIRLWDYVFLYKKIKELDQMKDEFISIASHELRTPVTSIRGFSSMFLDGSFGALDQKAGEAIKMINASAERLAVLVEDLLNVSRIEQGRMKIEPKKQDIISIIQESLDELKVQADKKGLKLGLKKKNIQSLELNIDKDRFKQILINLIGNSIKYTKTGSVDVILEKENHNIIIKIKDTGIGMSAEEREHLFEKFYRVQNKDTQKIIGTGLGLWITKKLTEAMGGKIFVDSIKGVGTQISLVFKIRE